jgi:hypothetical protein
MASAREENKNAKPAVTTVPEDIWLSRGGFGSNARWFAVSTVAHVLLLSVFATTAVTVMQKSQDMIKVTALPASQDPAQQAEEQKTPDDWEGEPSLKDLPGALSMEMLPHKKVKKWSSGPPPLAGRVQAIRPTALPIISSAFSPVTIQVGRTSDDLKGLTTQVTNLSGSLSGVAGGGFGDHVGGLRRVGIDVVLVVDATDSMQFVIDSVRERLSKTIEALQTMVDTTRVGIVAYRDKGEEYVTRWVDFSFSTSKLQGFLANLEASGGGDWPEALYEGVDVAIHDLSWRKKSRRIIVLVSGSSPHPETVSSIMNLAQGFRSQGGVVSAMDLAEKMHEDFERALWQRTAQLTKVAFKPSPLPAFYREFRDTMASISKAGGGEFIPLTEEKKLTRQIIILTFGTRWKTEMERFLRDLS